MKKALSIFLALALVLAGFSLAEAPNGNPPQPPQGEVPSGNPPQPPQGEAPMGEPPEKPQGEAPGGTPPQQPQGGAPGAPGGQSQPESYAAVQSVDSNTELTGAIESTATDESAVLVTAGHLALTDAAIVRTSSDSTGGDAASFYGVGAAVLAVGGEAEIADSIITTDANGGAGAFAYGDGVIRIRDTEIETSGGASGGVHVAGGGTLYAENLDVLTHGESSAAIRSDRGGGVLRATGGSYMTTGSGSPAVYVTADVAVEGAQLTAQGSEALCLEGRNSVRLTDCVLSGNLPDLSQNDNTWTVIVYQSMSGDAEQGEGRFEMSGGALKSQNGGLFYTTNTDSEFVLSGVEIEAAPDCEYFLRCTGNANARGWGELGKNGANCRFTAISQRMDGDVIWDSASTLTLYLTEGSALTGAVRDDESCAGEGGAGYCELCVAEGCRWVVTADSRVTSLSCEGEIVGADGKGVTIVGTDGTVYAQGDGAYTVTVSEYETACDLSGAGGLTEDN